MSDLLDKIWERTNKSGDCWLWTAGKDKNGYGLFRVNGKTARVARVIWRLMHTAPLLEREHVLHHCDNPTCVKPEHLFLGTHAENMADMAQKARANRPIGEANGRALLNAEKAAEIRKLVAEGKTQGLLAKQFGVSRGAIYHVLRGSTW